MPCRVARPSWITVPHLEMSAGLADQQVVELAGSVIQRAVRQWSMLSGLLASAAGYSPRAAGQVRRQPAGGEAAVLIYCARGGGWCEVNDRRQPVHRGDLLVLPPQVPHAYGAHRSNPWTIHWVRARGSRVPDYLRAMGVDAEHPVLRLGEDLPVLSLLNEVRQNLQTAPAPWNVFHAAHTLGHLLSVLIQHRGGLPDESSPGVQKVARSITYMSEHLHEPPRVGTLAMLAGLSPAHFSVLFRQQTGSSPHAYLHLLRMHRAVQWLTGTGLSVKEVADRLGYRDPFHFSRKFKEFSGVSPREYRESHHAPAPSGK